MDDNMLRMQQDAVERVRKMQQRARKYVEDDTNLAHAPFEHTSPSTSSSNESKGICAPTPVLQKKGFSFLSNFGDDHEQLFLLMIAILLVRNNAPIELILALLYVAM